MCMWRDLGNREVHHHENGVPVPATNVIFVPFVPSLKLLICLLFLFASLERMEDNFFPTPNLMQ